MFTTVLTLAVLVKVGQTPGNSAGRRATTEIPFSGHLDGKFGFEKNIPQIAVGYITMNHVPSL